MPPIVVTPHTSYKQLTPHTCYNRLSPHTCYKKIISAHVLHADNLRTRVTCRFTPHVLQAEYPRTRVTSRLTTHDTCYKQINSTHVLQAEINTCNIVRMIHIRKNNSILSTCYVYFRGPNPSPQINKSIN